MFNKIRTTFNKLFHQLFGNLLLIIKKIFVINKQITEQQRVIILLNKVIGQAKIRFNLVLSYINKHIFKQQEDSIVPEGILGISVDNGIVAIAHIVVNSLNDIIVKSFGSFIVDLSSNDQVKKVITKYITEYNLHNIECCYVLNSAQYVLSLIESVANDNKAREKAILWGIKDYINYSIDDAVLDYFEVPVVRSRDNAKLAYAVAMRAKESEEIGDLINATGARLKYIDINELCLINIMSLYNYGQIGYLLLKLSQDNISILLVRDNALLVSRNAKINIKKLDKFDPSININDDKSTVADNLVLELQRSLDYGKSIFKDLHFSSVNIFPCNINIDLFIPWAENQIGLLFNKIDLAKNIKFNIEHNNKQQAECLTAIGAGLRKIGTFYNASKN